MVKRGRRAVKRSGRVPRVLAVAGVALAVVAVVLLLRGDAPSAGEPFTVFEDMHGLAVDPSDAGAFYVATHTGLARGGAEGFVRVGSGADDLMGFLVHPTDGRTMWSSGHPADRSGGPNLGVRVSHDAGATWTTLLPGVDYHAMAVSRQDPETLFAAYLGELRRSDDAGATWRAVGAAPTQVYSISTHPLEPETLFAATGAGVLRSLDGGASWAPFVEGTATAFHVHPARPGTMLHATGSVLRRSLDGGSSWANLTLDPGAQTLAYVALSASAPDVIGVASFGGAIWRSDDAGATWALVRAPDP